MKMIGRMIMMGIKFLITLLLAIIVVIVLLNLYVIFQATPRVENIETISQMDPQAEIPALVLGAGVINNEEPSTILQLRLDAAYDLYQKQPNRQFIMSGDHREDNYNEVAVMKKYLIDRGIPSEQIYLDHAGYSTYESLYRAKNVYHQDQLIIITQGYHLSRALLLANHLKIDAIGLPAEESSSTRLKREFREIFARIKDLAVTLGYDAGSVELNYPIDLDQDGDQTNIKSKL
ncbi:YdcF family protein [Aerococcaceae bacterium DSM 111020]|nr:YdcF family protein [Aerococcaceae bacterium DSM 111020]